MKKSVGRVCALTLAVLGITAQAAAEPRLVRVADRPCIEALLRVPTAFENVAPFVAPDHRSKITTTPRADGTPMTELGLELKSCEREQVERDGVTTIENRVYELFVSLPASYRDVPGAVTLYALAIYTNSAKLHAGFAGMGLPSSHVSDIELRYDTGAEDPPGAPGQMTAHVPGPAGFTAVAHYARGLVPAQPITGSYRHPGSRGLVRDHHVAGDPFLVSAPLVSGSVTANQAGGFLARAMGAESGINSGGFLLDERGGFTGTATVVLE